MSRVRQDACVHCGGLDAVHEDEDEQRVCEACNHDTHEVCGEAGLCPRCWRVARWEAPIPRPTCREKWCVEHVPGPHEVWCEVHRGNTLDEANEAADCCEVWT